VQAQRVTGADTLQIIQGFATRAEVVFAVDFQPADRRAVLQNRVIVFGP